MSNFKKQRLMEKSLNHVNDEKRKAITFFKIETEHGEVVAPAKYFGKYQPSFRRFLTTVNLTSQEIVSVKKGDRLRFVGIAKRHPLTEASKCEVFRWNHRIKKNKKYKIVDIHQVVV